MKPSILYISYDGMLEPLGQSQVLSYLERLTADYRLHLISFEKKSDWEGSRRAEVAGRIHAAGIDWHPQRYHKAPSAAATGWDIAAGALKATRLVRRHDIKVVHARSYVAALMALCAKRRTGARLLFDMRGFWADERVDGGLWPADGRLYKGAKAAERKLLRNADHVVTLTRASTIEIERFPFLTDRVPPLSVIPTCADLDRFSPGQAAPPGVFTLGYVGSVGTWYMFDDLLDCFRILSERLGDARMLIVNRTEHEFIRSRLSAFGIADGQVELLAAAHETIPALIARMTVGAALIKPSYSKIASAPTKLAEYLGCGVPCLGNVGVGDMEEMLEGGRVGVALNGLSTEAKAAGVERLLSLLDEPDLSARCVAFARSHFSLEKGAADYAAIYRKLLAAR
jgi:glycosyltransferase involved in cell wall biosynthesis